MGRGRLFAQWLHHAFPLECPYPHVAGSTNPQTADEWMKDTGAETSVASEEVMRRFVEEAKAHEATRVRSSITESAQPRAEALPWSPQEELLVPRRRTGGGLRKIMLLVVLAAGAFSMLRMT